MMIMFNSLKKVKENSAAVKIYRVRYNSLRKGNSNLT